MTRWERDGEFLPGWYEDVSATDLDRERHWQRWAPEIGVPRRLVGASLLAEPRSDALARVDAYMKGPDFRAGRCLILAGPTGVGKSFAAVAALRELCRPSGHFYAGRLLFCHVPKLCDALFDFNKRQNTLDKAKRTRFVVLDDLGAEYVKEGGLSDASLEAIIWEREAEILPTIITTNLTAEGLKARLSERLIDRLRGDWGCIYECPGPSWRLA